MNKKILYISIFIVAVLINMHVFTDAFSDTAIPKVRLYGTSTYWADSTNYQTTNKSVYIHDSLKVGKDLYVGVKGGKIYMDTSRGVSQYIDENDFHIDNSKAGGIYIVASGSGGNIFLRSNLAGHEYLIGTGSTAYTWYKQQGVSETQIMKLDTATGLILNQGNIQLTGGTQQIKLPSDTASDYDANDAITLNRQSGTVTTKSLTTASDGFYTMTLTNSLIATTSKVFLSYCGGTESAGRPTVYRVVSNSGSATIILLNLTGAGSFNGNIKLNFVVFN